MGKMQSNDTAAQEMSDNTGKRCKRVDNEGDRRQVMAN
jgi:hypothetical protein